MTQAISSIAFSMQQTLWQSNSTTADGSFADWMQSAGQTQSDGSTTAANAADPLQQLISGLQNMLAATQEMASAPVPAGASTADDSLGASAGNTFTAQVDGGEAGYDSSYGYYVTDANGNPVSGQILFANVKDGGTAMVSGVDPSHIGFFIIPNGAGDNPGLTNGAPVTFQQVNGQWQAVDASGQPMNGSGAGVLFDNAALNGDGIAHAEDNPTVAGNQNWEDTYGGGDRDFNDVDVNVAWGSAPMVAIQATEATATMETSDGTIVNAEWASVTTEISETGGAVSTGDDTLATSASTANPASGTATNDSATTGNGGSITGSLATADLTALLSYFQFQLNPSQVLTASQIV